MSYSPSQFEDIAEAIRRKPGKKIAKDQQELLEKDESWIHQLKKRPHGAANVPTHVLQTVAAAHEARLEQQARKKSQPLQDARRNEMESSQPDGTPASSPERFTCDWSVSPADRRRRHDMPESSRVEETPHPLHVQPAYRKVAVDWKRNAGVPPMSSLEEEEEMEVQLPCAEDEIQGNESTDGHYRYPGRFASQEARRDTAQMANTPPCAQPDHDVIPATVIAEPRRVADDKKERPTRRHKPINFGDDSPTKPRGDTMASRGDRMQSLKHLQVAETQDTVVSSSIVPATLSQVRTQSGTNTIGESVQIISRQVVDFGSSAFVAEKSPSPELQSAKSHISDDEEMEESQDDGWTPLQEFKTAYPDFEDSYNGTQLNFVKACLCLEYLRGERALRDYLYDDFIRLFSFKYLDYVNNAGPDQEPLSAIEWFNIQSGRPLYNREVINNSNVDQVLAFYEADVASIRGLVEQHEEDEANEDKPELLPEEVQDSMEVDEPKMEAVVAEVAVSKQEDSREEEVEDEEVGDEEVEDERPISQPILQLISQPVSPLSDVVERRVPSPSRSTPRPISQISSPAKRPAEKAIPASGRVSQPISPPRARVNPPERRAASTSRPMVPPTSQTASPMNPPAERRASASAAAPIAGFARIPQTSSPRAGGRFFATAPPSSIRSNAPVGTQYMQQLSTRQASTSEERRERMRAAMRKRASASARSSSSKAGSAV